jgi:uncharacterized cupin superfamily protein
LLASVVVSAASFCIGVRSHDPLALSTFQTVIYSNIVALGLFALVLFFRTPYLLHKEAEERHVREIAAAVEQGRTAQKELISSLPTQAEWLALADRFGAFSYTRADWQTTRGETTWTLHESAICSLCTLAGSMLLDSRLIEAKYPRLLSQPDHLQRWLSYIKETKRSDKTFHGEETLSDGTKLFHYMGSIEVPKNSADICIEFAAHSGGRA